jgi:hypothetical protein
LLGNCLFVGVCWIRLGLVVVVCWLPLVVVGCRWLSLDAVDIFHYIYFNVVLQEVGTGECYGVYLNTCEASNSDGNYAQKWVYDANSGTFKVAATQSCLTAGGN